LGNPKYREYANDILTSSRHLLDLVNDVLDLSAIEAGKYSLTKEKLEIPEIVDECFRTIADVAKRKRISYTVEIPANLPPCYADRRGVKQILLNLLSNAVKFTLEGGSIKLRVAAADGHHTIEVIDTGQGIPANKMARLTNPFSRAESNPHKTQGGAGLGLSIVDSLLKLHGGELDIKSELGSGTTVSVKLPTAEH
jgi:two-component system cell cycle sensor histidine kinase PleC